MQNGIRALFLPLIAALLAAPMPAGAQVTTRDKHQGPFYNPENDTYYELRIDNHDPHPSGRGYAHTEWYFAMRRSMTKFYKGRRGRLAVLADEKSMQFVHKHFDIAEETWIGLRFYCRFRKLLWVNGEVHPLRKKAFWARESWKRNDGVNCRSDPGIGFMGVYLTASNLGARWQAVGSHKGFWGYLVEYPPLPKKHKDPKDAASGAKKSGGTATAKQDK